MSDGVHTRHTWLGEIVVLDEVVAAHMAQHPRASLGEVLEHVHRLCPAWVTMRDDVARSLDLWESEAHAWRRRVGGRLGSSADQSSSGASLDARPPLGRPVPEPTRE